jgi:hypothetical protein
MLTVTENARGRVRRQMTAPVPSASAGEAIGADPAQYRAGLLAASVLLLASLVYYFSSVSIGWKNAISDSHGFRQSQTAITADVILRGGPWLIYETPVLGPPWRVPFEFPLYQWIVAALAWSTGMALDPAGRMVSVAFFLLTLWPTERILAALRVTLPRRLIVLALLVCSPFYIFWSRTFLIESTALFLATSSLACTIWAIRRPSAGRLLATSVVGSFAAVVKITTFFPFAIASMALICYQVLRRGGPLENTRWIRRGWLVVACGLVPAVALTSWTSAADHAKKRSILARRLMSTNLTTWNFGTLKQRQSAETWSMFAFRTELPLGRQVPFVVAALSLVMARRRLAEIAGCVLLYLVGILTFTNLFYYHDYYYFANNIFLIVAVGMAIVAMLEAGRPLKAGAIAGLVLLLGFMVFDYSRLYRPMQAHNASSLKRLGAAIRDRTSPDDIVVLLGFSWSSEVPYYSGRRAMCLADWDNPAQVAAGLKTLAPYHIGAVVVLPPIDKPISREALLVLLRKQGFEPERSPVEAPYELLLPAHRPPTTDETAPDGTRANVEQNSHDKAAS